MNQDPPPPGETAEVQTKRPPDSMPGLADASKRLEREFKGAIPLPAIEETLRASYRSLAATATVHNYLSIFAERLAREKLHQLARQGQAGGAGPGQARPRSLSA